MVYGLHRTVWICYRLKICSLQDLVYLCYYIFYFDLEAKHVKVQQVSLSSHEVHELDLLVWGFFFFKLKLKAFDLEINRSFPNFFYPLIFNRCTLSCQNSSRISNISTCYIIILKNYRYECWSTTRCIIIWLRDNFL